MVPRLPDSFIILDSSEQLFTDDILYPFAIDEILCRQVGEGVRPPTIHLWRHQQAFVLGLRDRKLPQALESMAWLEGQGYKVTVRNSGGAAVPLDPGVLNLSIILPNHAQKMGFHQDFELMYQVIGESLRSFDLVNKGEIEGAYCPGDFDLSIRGRKFCGIAQRRQTKAFVVQAFIVVEGSGKNRAELVRDFYKRAAGNVEKGDHPLVSPSSMASLQEVCRIDSLEQYRDSLLGYFLQRGGQMEEPKLVIFDLNGQIHEMIESLRWRYVKRG